MATAAARIAYHAIELGAMQKQDELEQLLELLMHRWPRRVLELGVFMGGTVWAWRQLGCDVWAIDDGSLGRLNTQGAHHLIAGDSHDPRSWRAALRASPFDFLFIDGDHSYAGVKQDLDWYGPLVRRGGLIALHDIVRDARVDIEVWKLWRELPPRGKSQLLTEPRKWGGIGLLEVA